MLSRSVLFLWFLCFPAFAFAAESDNTGFAVGFIVAAIIAWSASIQLCRAGGSWILLGVIIGVFAAVPLTGYAFIGALYLKIH
jgi:hypothetical protein